jgi:NADPH2:quinone reductase
MLPLMQAVYIERPGGPDALVHGERPEPTPAAGEVLVRVAFAGVNFIDTYHRSGLYTLPLPAILGSEGAGTVEAVGDGVAGFAPGDRVAYANARGSYGALQSVPAAMLVHVPEAVSLEIAAAVMLQGMTAHYLTHSTVALASGQTCLIHAAAGGTGRLMVQMATLRGARVIATAGSAAKVALTLGDGASAGIDYSTQDFVAEVRRLTDGRGVDVVYDGVGQATFLKGLDCLRPRGTMVIFGNASGPIAPFDPLMLSAKGSLYVTRPTLASYIARRDELDWRARDLFTWIAAGTLQVRVDKVYPLADAAQAHTDLAARKTTGKLLLAIG